MPPANPAKVAKTDDVDGVISKAIEEIDSVQNQLEDLSDQASQEILKVEQKYNALRKPHYEKRAEVIAKIPNFWATVFLNHPQVSAILSEDDEAALQSLTKVEVEEMEGEVKSGYKISLHFGPNDFFEDKEITKEINQAEPDLSKSSNIRWKKGKCLVKPANAAANAAGKKRKSDEQGSFFSWFTKNSEEGFDEIADAIKDEVWPNPLQFYLGEEEGEEDDGGDDEEAEEEDDEDGEEDEDGEGAEEDEDDEEEAEEEED